MNQISNVILKPLKTESSFFLKGSCLHYTLNGVRKQWNQISPSDSVATNIFNTSRKVLIFVRQFRPGVYLSNIPESDRVDGLIDTKKYPARLGETLEMCAGRVDKPENKEKQVFKSPKEVMVEEIMEECGYEVQSNSLETIGNCKMFPYNNTADVTLFHCEVTDDMKKGKGGGVLGENIEIVEMSVPEVKDYIREDCNSPAGFLWGISWFLYHKKL